MLYLLHSLGWDMSDPRRHGELAEAMRLWVHARGRFILSSKKQGTLRVIG